MPPGSASKGEPMNEIVPDARFKGRHMQPLTIRLKHWMKMLFIVLMAGSGLEALLRGRVIYGW